MRNLTITREKGMINATEPMTFLIDGTKAGTILIPGNKVFPISGSAHTLQIKGSLGLGKSSEMIELPSGTEDLRITAYWKREMMGARPCFKDLAADHAVLSVTDSEKKHETEGFGSDADENTVETGGGMIGFVKGKIKEQKENQKKRIQKLDLLQRQFEQSEVVQSVISYLMANSGDYHLEGVPCSDSLSWVFHQQAYDDRSRYIMIDQDGIQFLWYDFETVRDAYGKHVERRIHGKWGIVFRELGYAPLDKTVYEGVKIGRVDVVQAFVKAFVKAFTEAFPDMGELGTPNYETYNLYVGGIRPGYMISYRAKEKQWKSLF